MKYRCPKCGRHGMPWDARAKVLMCYYNTCRHVVRIQDQKATPSPEETLAAIERDANEVKRNAMGHVAPV
jgi:hypothetical protein